MVPEVQKPSQEPCIAFYPKRRIRNLLREKHFHGVSSGSRHEYLLKLRYGKVRSYRGLFHLSSLYTISTVIDIQASEADLPMLHDAWLWSLCLHCVDISATLWEHG